MSEINPYARFLDGRPLEIILAESAPAIAAHLKAIGPQKTAAAPAPGKWSPAETVCHLADCEIVFAFRLRQALAEDAPTLLRFFDQDKWAAIYPGISAAEALAAFSAFRTWNLGLIKAALPAAADRPVTHPEWGTITLLTLIETMAGHDLNHLAQLAKLAAA